MAASLVASPIVSPIASSSSSTASTELDDVAVDDLGKYLRESTFDAATINPETLLMFAQACERLFCADVSPQRKFRMNEILFGSYTEYEARFKLYSTAVVQANKVLIDFEDQGVAIDTDVKKQILSIIENTVANISHGKEMMGYLYRQIFVNNKQLSRTLAKTRMDDFFQDLCEDQMKPHQKLLRYYLEISRRRKYRKIFDKETLFEPMFTDDELHHFTHYFRPVFEMDHFVYEAIYPYAQHVNLFAWLTDKPGTAKSIANHLTKCVDDSLPVLIRDRTKFSYRNGVYDADQDIFYPYFNNPNWPYCSDSLGSDVVACHYLDYDFEYEKYEEAIRQNNDPMDIPTPNCQVILDSQKFCKEISRWSYASIGRMIFPVGAKDNWQYFPFYKGVAGSGKSTLLTLSSHFYSPADVGALMSEGQRNFSIEHLYDKYVFFCMDLDKKMTLSQTRWNLMVSGEVISVERKFKVPVQMSWTVTGAFAGNTYPPWIDEAGNASRRLLVFLFDEIVDKVDPKLFDKCKAEMPAFMKKCVACFLDMVEKHGKKGIWDEGVLPTYFHNSRKVMQAATNPLTAFVIDADQCLLDNNAICTFTAFRARYQTYRDAQKLSHEKLSDSFMKPVFHASKIRIIKPPADLAQDIYDKDYHGQSTKYLLGIKLIG
jgi:hypothetical protein